MPAGGVSGGCMETAERMWLSAAFRRCGKTAHRVADLCLAKSNQQADANCPRSGRQHRAEIEGRDAGSAGGVTAACGCHDACGASDGRPVVRCQGCIASCMEYLIIIVVLNNPDGMLLRRVVLRRRFLGARTTPTVFALACGGMVATETCARFTACLGVLVQARGMACPGGGRNA